MIVSLNSFILNDPTAAFLALLDEPISGLSVPPIRTSSGTRSGQHGGYVAVQFFNMRPITLTGALYGDSPQTLEAARSALEQAVTSAGPITMTVVTNGGKTFLIKCYLDSLDIPMNISPIKAPFKISLIAPDPVIYDATAGASLSFTINKAVPGGVQFTSTSPQFGSSFYFSAGQPSATVNNSGSIEIYPVINIVGQTTNPVIVNKTTGDTFKMAGYSVPAGSTTSIDMKAHTITLNGGNVLSYWDTTSQWISLVPGDNQIELQSGSSSDVAVAVGTYLPGAWGI